MNYTIGKMYAFDSAHHLTGLPPDHKCSRNHGHSYTVELALSCTDLDEVGFVVDYAHLDEIMKPVLQMLDHQDLNEVLPVNPTAENLARVIFSMVEQVVHRTNETIPDPEGWVRIAWVEVKETGKTFARVTP